MQAAKTAHKFSSSNAFVEYEQTILLVLSALLSFAILGQILPKTDLQFTICPAI